jgi:hypothetical protein
MRVEQEEEATDEMQLNDAEIILPMNVVLEDTKMWC